MSSAPPATGVRVSPELYHFFQVELRNGWAMESEAIRKGRLDEIPPPATLDSAHDSLCQAPLAVVADWMTTDGTVVDYDPTHALIEFGQLLALYGPDALLSDFENCEW